MEYTSNTNNNILSKGAVVEWVNSSIEPPQHYHCIKDIPSKVAAAFMNDIFGDAMFPMRGVNFGDDSDIQVAKRNCEAVLEGAGLLGFQTTFSGLSWADGVKDFGGVLLFWRWLRQKSLEKPLSRCIPAIEIGLQQQQQQQNNAAAAVAGGGGENLLTENNLNHNNAVNNRCVVRLSDVAASCGVENHNPSSSASNNNTNFYCGGQNGEVGKSLFESNYKELHQMRKIHEDLAKAISEGNLNRIVHALQRGHHGIY